MIGKEEKHTVLELRTVLGSGVMHLDIIKGFTLTEIVVIGGGE
jgi:hypothetical protein